VLYKLFFALVLKLYGTSHRTILKKNVTSEVKKSRNPMGHGARKWYQTNREGISYRYHKKMREVSAIPRRKVFKKENIQGLYLLAL
jgi:hypothetical protein